VRFRFKWRVQQRNDLLDCQKLRQFMRFFRQREADERAMFDASGADEPAKETPQGRHFQVNRGAVITVFGKVNEITA